MDWFMENIGNIFDIVSNVVATAALVAALTPTPKDDGVVAKVRGVINILGLNFGFAKNR